MKETEASTNKWKHSLYSQTGWNNSYYVHITQSNLHGPPRKPGCAEIPRELGRGGAGSSAALARQGGRSLRQRVNRNILLPNVLQGSSSVPLLALGDSKCSFTCDCIPPTSSSIEKTSQGFLTCVFLKRKSVTGFRPYLNSPGWPNLSILNFVYFYKLSLSK